MRPRKKFVVKQIPNSLFVFGGLMHCICGRLIGLYLAFIPECRETIEKAVVIWLKTNVTINFVSYLLVRQHNKLYEQSIPN